MDNFNVLVEEIQSNAQKSLTPEQMKVWIDKATPYEIMEKWRFEPAGSPWCTGEVGEYLGKKWIEMRKNITPAEYVQMSKALTR